MITYMKPPSLSASAVFLSIWIKKAIHFIKLQFRNKFFQVVSVCFSHGLSRWSSHMPFSNLPEVLIFICGITFGFCNSEAKIQEWGTL